MVYVKMGKLNLTWQYNGVAPWNDIIKWCGLAFGPPETPGHRIKRDWGHNFETIRFNKEEHYTMFMLKWGS
jgi:hypothetical protein